MCSLCSLCSLQNWLRDNVAGKLKDARVGFDSRPVTTAPLHVVYKWILSRFDGVRAPDVVNSCRGRDKLLLPLLVASPVSVRRVTGKEAQLIRAAFPVVVGSATSGVLSGLPSCIATYTAFRG